MKHTFLVLGTVIMAIIAGCSKSKKSPTYHYAITNLHDVGIRQFKDTTITITLNAVFDSGTAENLSVSLLYLPAGMTVTPASVSGSSNFNAVFTARVRSLISGTFPVTVQVTGSTTGIRTYTFNLIASASDNPCIDQMLGDYIGNDACSPANGEQGYSSMVEWVGNSQVNIPLAFGIVRANVNCNNTFTLEPYNNGAFSVTGNGTFNSGTITVNYRKSGGTTYTCVTTLTRK